MEPQGNRQRAGWYVFRLNVRLHAVELQNPEGGFEYGLKALPHIALPGKGGTYPIPEIGTLKISVKHLTQVHRPKDAVVLSVTKEERHEVVPSIARQVLSKSARINRWRRPVRQEAPAGPDKGSEFFVVLRQRRANLHSPSLEFA